MVERISMSEQEKQIILVNNKNTENYQVHRLFVNAYSNKSLLQIVQDNNIGISNICQGNGTCGKCKIKVVSGELPITETDRKCLTDEELSNGIRLACKVKTKNIFEYNSNNEVILEFVSDSEENIVVEAIPFGEGERKKEWKKSEKKRKDKIDDAEEASFFIAIDIGTTTIAMALVDEQTGEICDTYISLNHQRKFGADILSRITAANNGKAEVLKCTIEADLWTGICTLVRKADRKFVSISLKNNEVIESCENVINKINISRIIISGNTTMVHLLMGYSCQSLGKYPFSSRHLEQIECTLKECIKLETVNNETLVSGGVRASSVNHHAERYKIYENTPITILPGIAAFIGSDLTAGILTCPGFESEEICFLIDLGTNGEMVLGNKNNLLTTSTAAGPAFEGGNIVCGTAGIPGSINGVKIQNQRAIVKTLKNLMPPIGICGSGLVSAVAQLKQNGIINEKGELKYPYDKLGFPLWTFKNGEKIALYQKDIREFQLAKSAIRAGIEILMKEYGCEIKEITRIYLAGGLGVNLAEEDAIMTGILPEEFRGKTVSIGNGALKGAIQYGMETVKVNKVQIVESVDTSEIEEKINHIVQRSRNISLAENRRFQELYLKYMEF